MRLTSKINLFLLLRSEGGGSSGGDDMKPLIIGSEISSGNENESNAVDGDLKSLVTGSDIGIVPNENGSNTEFL